MTPEMTPPQGMSMPRRAQAHRLRALLLTLLFGLVVSLALLAGPGTGQAQAKDWWIDEMDVLLDVQTNGDVLVDEKTTFTFEGSFSYVTRGIPTENTGGITDIEVFDANGTPLPEGDAPGTYSTSTEGGYLYITLNIALADTSETWTFHYRGESVIQFFDEGDELRWYVFDAETPVPINKARATVTLPGTVASTDMTHAVQTGYGVEARVNSPAASTMVYEAVGFPPNTNFWIVTGFPKGVVEFTWTAERVAAFLVPKIGFLLPIAFMLAMLLLWRKRGRDDPSAMYAKYVSEPPSDLSPGIVGALIDERVDTKEVIATIVDLARRGYLEITDTKKDGVFSKPETIFTRKKPLDDLQGFEAKVAEALFDANHPNQVTSKELKNHFYVHVEPIVERIYTETTAAGLFNQEPQDGPFPLAGLRFPDRGHPRRSDGAHGHARRARLGLVHVRLHTLRRDRLGVRAAHAPADEQRRPGAAQVGGLPQLPGGSHPVPGHGDGPGAVREVPALRRGPGRGKAVGAEVRGIERPAADVVSPRVPAHPHGWVDGLRTYRDGNVRR